MHVVKELLELYAGLKVNTAKWARYWVEDGCPTFTTKPQDRNPIGYPTEPLTITEALVPFRAAGAGMDEDERSAFLAAISRRK
jgi:hypothetical protein